jgi:hypothetical protein
MLVRVCTQGLFGLTIVGFSLLAACSLDVQGRQDDPGATPSSDVIPGPSSTTFEDGGSVGTPGTPIGATAPATPDGSIPPPPPPPPQGVTCGGAQCSGGSNICCVESKQASGVTRTCTTSGACKGAALACDAPDDCTGGVCCLSEPDDAHLGLPVPISVGDEKSPDTQCAPTCGGEKKYVVCDPAVGCANGDTCIPHPFLDLHYCR